MTRLDRAHWALLAALKQHQTLTAAAEAVHISQAAASQRLREAERRLGILLVERKGKSLRLNASGLRIAETGERLERQLGDAELDALWLGQRTRQRWRLAQGCHDSPTLVALLSRICSGPGLERDLELVRCAQNDPLRLLQTGEADCALLPQVLEARSPDRDTVAQDGLLAVVPRAHPLADKVALKPADFAGHAYFTYSLNPQPDWEYERFFKPAGYHPGGIVRVESTEAILALVAGGQGLSILPGLPCRLAAQHRVALVPLAGQSVRLAWRLVMATGVIIASERKQLLQVTRQALSDGATPLASPPL